MLSKNNAPFHPLAFTIYLNQRNLCRMSKMTHTVSM